MSEPFKLFRLQQIDSRRDEGVARIAEIEAIMSDDTDKKSAELELNTAEQSYQEAQKELKRAEENVRSQEQKIEQNQKKLYSGSIGNPKELQDLQNEAEALKRHLTTLEDIQLEKMMSTDSAEAVKTNRSETLSQLIEETSSRDEKFITELQALQNNVDRLTGEREAALPGIPEEDIALYEKLRKKKSGLAVAAVADNSCTACGSQLHHALAQAARSPNKISQCDTCGRILHSG